MNKQGQGDTTESKERGLALAFSVNLRIFQNRFGEKTWARYFHFDLNSGSGMNEEVGCIGSPLAFLQAARSEGCERFFAAFVDRDREKIASLDSRPELDARSFCFCGDNAAFIEMIPALIRLYGDRPEKALGSVLSDPNGTQVPLDGLRWLSSECPGLDIFMNWNSTQFKRELPQFAGRMRLCEAVESLNKEHWLIRRPLGCYQFTLLMGRNRIRAGGHRSLGFHDLRSTEGQHILEICSYSVNERNGRHQATLL